MLRASIFAFLLFATFSVAKETKLNSTTTRQAPTDDDFAALRRFVRRNIRNQNQRIDDLENIINELQQNHTMTDCSCRSATYKRMIPAFTTNYPVLGPGTASGADADAYFSDGVEAEFNTTGIRCEPGTYLLNAYVTIDNDATNEFRLEFVNLNTYNVMARQHMKNASPNDVYYTVSTVQTFDTPTLVTVKIAQFGRSIGSFDFISVTLLHP